MDRIVTGITEDGGVVCYAIDSSHLVARAAQLHQTSEVASSALGRLLTAASLMGSQMKGKDESMTLRVKGDGPLGAIIAVSDFNGNVRGYVERRDVQLPPTVYGHPDVGAAVGKNGTLTVMKEFGLGLDPYIGNIQLVSGEIAEDLTAYFAHSEQIPSALALGVTVGESGIVEFAGGFLAQLLPGASEEAIDTLEANLATLPAVTTLLAEGKTPEDMVDLVLAEMNPGIINTMPVEYLCNCSRERVEKALISIGVEDLQELQEEEELVEVSCHFCNKKYKFNKDEIGQLIQQATQSSSAPEEEQESAVEMDE